MQPSSIVHGVPFSKKPRLGQQKVFDQLQLSKYLNVKLPTGYGKTFVACGSYSILKHQGRVNRMLAIFPTDAQLTQFKSGGSDDLSDAGVDGPLQVIDLRFFGVEALKKHRNNKAQVYAITIQSLINRTGMDLVNELFASGGRWMVVVDEYHHYGVDGAWGKAVMQLPAEFVLAMSATPKRRNDDSAFGDPNVSVTYRDAVEENAVKELEAHSYVYRLDIVGEDGDVESLTTDDLVRQAGGDAPEKIESFLITRKMRWSPKYVSPLVSIPLERLLRERLKTEYKLQAIVGAMSVSHAEMVCQQIKSMFGDVLSVDWVGTGSDGRKPEENSRVLSSFCSAKKNSMTGERDHTLDVLVHVGMAGEGLDSVDVSEVIHLNAASWNNSNDQENGRAARYREGVTGHINFDSTSEYARLGYIGAAIMDAMDENPPRPNESRDEFEERGDGEYEPIPDEPAIHIHNLELDHIDSGSPEVVRMKKVLALHIREFSADDLTDPDSQIHELALREYKAMRKAEAEELNEESTVKQWQESVNTAMSAVTGLARRKLYPDNQRFDRTILGDIKKRIYTRKKRELGQMDKSVEACRRHYAWIKALEHDLLNDMVPKWLV